MLVRWHAGGEEAACEMRRSRDEPAAGEERYGSSAAAEGVMRRRERELMAQLHELLFPTSSLSPSGASSSSLVLDSVAAADSMADGCSPVNVAPAVSCGGRRQRRSGTKRAARDVEQLGGEELVAEGVAATSAIKPACLRRRKEGATTLVTTVPDFDGYQWRKYGQKHIEASNHPRSYYRCTNSTEQGCPAKRTVQRNDDDDGGGPPKFTVVYISEHTCKTTESAVAPVILETAVRPSNPTASSTHGTVNPAAESSITAGTDRRTSEPSPASSDITWSGGGDAVPSEHHGDYSCLFAPDGWVVDPAAAAAVLQQETFFPGPIRSPVHVENWTSYGLFFSELSAAPSSSCHFFGF